MHGKPRVFDAYVGSMSLVGCHGEPPLSFGNYFWLRDGPRVTNMWAENLTHARKNLLTDGKVHGWWWDGPADFHGAVPGWFVVDDGRLPDDYYNDKMCWTGGPRPTADIAKEMFSIRGNEGDALLEWTDPEAYWKARNGTYDPKTGFVTVYLDSAYQSVTRSFAEGKGLKWSDDYVFPNRLND
jgi:hypothetical protein